MEADNLTSQKDIYSALADGLGMIVKGVLEGFPA